MNSIDFMGLIIWAEVEEKYFGIEFKLEEVELILN